MSLLASAWRTASRPLTPPHPPLASSTQPGRAPTGVGPHTRIVLTGTAPHAAVALALTRAWRTAGQPLVVVVSAHGDPGTVAAVRGWEREHRCVGHEVQTRWTTLASSPGVVLDLDAVAR